MTPISDERLAEMLAEVEDLQQEALNDADADQNPQLAIDAVGEFALSEMRSILTEIQSLRAQVEAAEEANKARMDERTNLIETKRQQIERLELSRGAASKVALNAIERAEAAEARVKELEPIVEAVAHIGVNFGYGPYVLEDKYIEAARTALKGGSNG